MFKASAGENNLYVDIDYGTEKTIGTVYIMTSAYEEERWEGDLWNVQLFVLKEITSTSG